MPAKKAEEVQEVHVGRIFSALKKFFFYKKETHWEGGDQVFTLMEDEVQGHRAFSGKIKQGPRKLVTNYSFKASRPFTKILAIWMLVGFSLFIVKESCDTVVWSTWPLQENSQYEMLHSRIVLLRTMLTVGKVINYSIGWTMPIFMVAYELNWQAQNAYADSLTILCSINATVKPPVDVVGKSAPSTAWAPDGKAGATPTTATPDYGQLTGVVVGPPEFNSPPVVPGAIVLDEAADMAEIAKWVGWGKTVIFPCTSTSIGASIVRAKSPFGFEAIAFTKSGGPACEALKSVGSLWVAVQGEIVFYQQGGTYEIILNTPQDIQGTWPLVAGG
jgi:hypothetical protein